MSLYSQNVSNDPLMLDGLVVGNFDEVFINGVPITISGYVPYTGATQNVDLGLYNLNAGQGGFSVVGTRYIAMNPGSGGFSQIVTGDIIKIQNGSLNDLVVIDSNNYRTTFVTPVTIQNGSTDVLRTDGLSRIFLPLISGGTIRDQFSYVCINSSNQLVLTSLASASTITVTGTSSNGDFRFCMLLGSGVQPPYIDNNNFLRYNPATGALTLTTGSLTMSNGSVLLSSGNVTLSSGNLTLTSGNATLTSGNLTLTSGDITVSNGNLTFNQFTNINSGGFINKVGAINFNTGKNNGQLFIGDGANNYISFVNSYYGGGTPYVLFNQVASFATNIQMANSLGENFLYTNDSTTYPFSISAGVYRTISIISTGSTPIMKFMSIGANPLVSMTNVRASFNSLNGAPLEIFQPLSGAGYNNHIRFSMTSGVLHLIGQDDTTGNSLFTNPSGIANALCIGSNFNFPTIIYNQGTPIFRFSNLTTTNYLDTTNSATISIGTFTTGTALRTPYLNITGTGDLKMFGNTLETNSGNLIINTQGTSVNLNSGATYLTFTKVGTGVYQTASAGGFTWNIVGGGTFMTLDSAGGLTINGTSVTSIVTTANLNSIASNHLNYKVDNYSYNHKFWFGFQHNLSISGTNSGYTYIDQPNGGVLAFSISGNEYMRVTSSLATINTPLSCNTLQSVNLQKSIQFGNTNYTNFANTNTVFGDSIRNGGNWLSGNYQLFSNTTNPNGGTGGLGVWGGTGTAGIISLQPGVSWQNLYLIGGSVLAYHTSVLGSTLTATGWVNSSDQRFKTNIRPIKTTRSLERVLAVKPYTYNMIYDEGQCPISDKLKKQQCLGFIAQEIAESNPHCIHEVVDKGEIRFGLQYNDYVVHLCGSVQEQQKMISALQAETALRTSEVKDLQAQVDSQQTIINELLKKMNQILEIK